MVAPDEAFDGDDEDDSEDENNTDNRTNSDGPSAKWQKKKKKHLNQFL